MKNQITREKLTGDALEEWVRGFDPEKIDAVRKHCDMCDYRVLRTMMRGPKDIGAYNYCRYYHERCTSAVNKCVIKIKNL